MGDREKAKRIIQWKYAHTPVGWPFEQLTDSKQTVNGVNDNGGGDDRWWQLSSGLFLPLSFVYTLGTHRLSYSILGALVSITPPLNVLIIRIDRSPKQTATATAVCFSLTRLNRTTKVACLSAYLDRRGHRHNLSILLLSPGADTLPLFCRSSNSQIVVYSL